jgi:hypothetical protein
MADNVGFTPGSGATIAADDVGGVLYQRMKLAFGDDGSASDVSDTNHLPISYAGTVFDSSATNNTTAQLASGATWTGGIEYAYNHPAAQVTVLCDRSYTVVLNQFLDAGGTQLEATYTFSRAANVPFNENIKIPGDYFQVKVTNTGSTTTTTLNVTTSYGPMETLPSTLSNQGNLRVSLQETNAVVTTNDEQIALLRRMVKLMESQATVDAGNRQRVSLDAAPATVTVAQATASNLNVTLGGVSTVNIAGYNQQQFIDVARTAYNTGIRSKLTFS